MNDKMQPISFKNILNWIISEYETQNSIFNISKQSFIQTTTKQPINIFNQQCELPLGPAAGPHTQLSQNIITAYLTGSRFFELKTIQVLDELEFDKPCIHAEDEGYNTEWSTELSTEQAYDEYLKAWMVLHFLKFAFNTPLNMNTSTFIFNMSVGYDLKGIKSKKVNTFIENMKNGNNSPKFREYKSILLETCNKLQDSKSFNFPGNIESFVNSIPATISNSITLSTMHGCPPEDIESICKYLIKEKDLHVFVKLNPTLLGYDFVRDVFDTLGYKYIALKKESFLNDLQYDDAVKMLQRLIAFAQKQEKQFGVKLSNTLPVINQSEILPGQEKYMSGNILFPLTINLASKIAGQFSGQLPISYSGGADITNIVDILNTGIQPVTLATDLLKPGGYLRLTQIALEIFTKWQIQNTIDPDKVKILAKNSLLKNNSKKHWFAHNDQKTEKQLPLFDCAIAPCIEACPIKQDIPQYLELLRQEKYSQAIDLIINKNALPNITGTICDHECQYNCTRKFYDEPLKIRGCKLIAATKGWPDSITTAKPLGIKVAIIGAGPSGLSAGFFLARAGLSVTIFEKQKHAGGVVANIIPDFRISRASIDKDINLIKSTGVKIITNWQEKLDLEKLHNQGFKYIYLAIGSSISRQLNIKGGVGATISALDFLHQYKNNLSNLNPGKNIAVIGGGNTAMDAARAALRLPDIENVYVIYRRTREFMTADYEELELAQSEGAIFKELVLPIEFHKPNTLILQKMRLGQTGKDGRRIPEPIPQNIEEITVDTVITALGENTDLDLLRKCGIKTNDENHFMLNINTLETNLENVFLGGDARRGPASIVKAIADGQKVTSAILKKEKISSKQTQEKIITNNSIDPNQRGLIISSPLNLESQQDISAETNRCLQCHLHCNRCVEVCPNRANIALEIQSPLFNDKYQIIHLDGMCNECGNCSTFCPYNNNPYKDKFTIFWTEKDFLSSFNNGCLLQSYNNKQYFKIRLDQEYFKIPANQDGTLNYNPNSSQPKMLKVTTLLEELMKNRQYLLTNTIDRSK